MLWQRGSLPHPGFRDQIRQGQRARHGLHRVQRRPHPQYLSDFLNAVVLQPQEHQVWKHLRSAGLLVTRGGQRREKGNEQDTTSRRKSNGKIFTRTRGGMRERDV